MRNPVKYLKLNGLQYNPNRDPEFYRGLPNHPFRLQASLDGTGTAVARFEVEGKTICEKSVPLPGKFDCEVSFDTPGTRIGAFTLEFGQEKYHQDIRLDVMEHEWIG